MKISLIATVLNEEKDIKSFLDSIENQTLLPDEIIVVDAGSTDGTIAIIKKHSSVRLILKKVANRSLGRNLAIESAKHSIIAVSDVGCTLDKDWLKRITKPFESSKVDAVAGFYKVKAKTVFQKCLAPFVAIMSDKLNLNTYLPSSRSLAFKKSAWRKVGGYPEDLNYCEDLSFAKNLKAKTNLVVEPKALVYWQMVESLKDYFYQIQNYATGDVQAKYKPHIKKIISVYLRYLIFIIFPSLFFLYLFWPVFKHYSYVKTPKAIAYLPLVQLTTDLGIIVGSLKGVKILV